MDMIDVDALSSKTGNYEKLNCMQAGRHNKNQLNWVRCKTDASLVINEILGLSVIFTKKDNHIINTATRRMKGPNQPLEAEAMEICMAMESAISKDYRKVVFGSNNSSIIEMMQGMYGGNTQI
ncbi:unnamed protein product [Vicia faba]|uniref:RNase H type-1 domain-containing protein n=1 Tax=Vicia faba TaxID=3906 RepID=A0AAV0ZJH8_VICFA|nr:unnamed protein product [Vicia faba]